MSILLNGDLSLKFVLPAEEGSGSLMEQLARLTASQSGVDLGEIDPRSGAARCNRPHNKREKTELNLRKAKVPAASDLANTPRMLLFFCLFLKIILSFLDIIAPLCGQLVNITCQ